MMSDFMESWENLLTAVVIVNNSSRWNDFITEKCCALVPVVNKWSLEYTLLFLKQHKIKTVILVSDIHKDLLEDKIKKMKGISVMNVSVKGCKDENICSLGEIMRFIKSDAIVKTSFLLLDCLTVTTVNFFDAAKFHIKLVEEKSVTMTMLVETIEDKPSQLFKNIIVMDASSNQLIKYANPNKRSRTPLSLLNNKAIKYCLYTDVCICHPIMLDIFANNTGVHSMEEFLEIILGNESLHGPVYCHEITTGFVMTIKDVVTYKIINSLVMQQGKFPKIKPEEEDNRLIFSKNAVLKENEDVLNKSLKIKLENVVLGSKTSIEKNAIIVNSVIGKKCFIQKNVYLNNVVIMDGCTIEKNSTLEHCIIGENCKIKTNCVLQKCAITANRIIEDRLKLGKKIITEQPWDSKDVEFFRSRIRLMERLGSVNFEENLKSLLLHENFEIQIRVSGDEAERADGHNAEIKNLLLRSLEERENNLRRKEENLRKRELEFFDTMEKSLTENILTSNLVILGASFYLKNQNPNRKKRLEIKDDKNEKQKFKAKTGIESTGAVQGNKSEDSTF